MFFSIMAILFATNASAQVMKVVTPSPQDTLVNADTLTIDLTPSGNDVAGFHVRAVKASGTVAGKVILYGSIDGTNWVPAVHDSAAIEFGNTDYILVTYPITSYLPYAKYRAEVITSGTCKITGIKGVILRRTR